MNFVWPSAIVGGIVGAVAAYYLVMSMSRRVLEFTCPKCGEKLEGKRPGKRTVTQVVWGGWTCPNCGCDVDRKGRDRMIASNAKSQVDPLEFTSDFGRWFSSTRTVQEILHRPYLLILEPQLFVIKPWIISVLLSVFGIAFGVAFGAKQGAEHGAIGSIEGALLAGFVCCIIFSIIGGAFAIFAWLVRSAVQLILRRRSFR